MKSILRGGCLCGRTRYTIDEEPTDVGDCHCVDCRRGSAAAYVTWGTVPRPSFRLESGELRNVPHATRIRSFAACCGTPLLFAEGPDTPTVDFTIASLDDPTPFAPKYAIWTEDHLPWVPLNGALPAYQQRTIRGTD